MTTLVLPGSSQAKRALFGINFFGEPLCTAYAWAAFILYKELGASAFQLTLLMLLKPVVTILSPYWSASGGPIKSNLLWAGFWMRAPFLLCPWVDSSWYLIAACVNYMFFFRAAAPAWMEILKRKLSGYSRFFSYSSALGYLTGAAISLTGGKWLDATPGNWKWLFFFSALIGLAGMLFQVAIPLKGEMLPNKREKIPLRERLQRPWLDSFSLMKSRVDFAHFQWGYMLCGFGIMIIQPALPLFAVDELNISYLEVAAAISIAKGLGYVLSSPIWARWMDRFSIFVVAAVVFSLFGLFPLLLSLGSVWLYVAYFCYGIGQGGSHLTWNLSGPLFAGKEDSSRFTRVSVVLGGLRGAIAPSLGGWIAVVYGSQSVLWIGGLLSLIGALYLLQKKKIHVIRPA